MQAITAKLRPFYVQGISEFDIKLNTSLPEWLKKNNYWEINGNISIDFFELSVFDEKKLLEAFVYDCSRLSISAFESVCGIVIDSQTPKSIAWAIIRTYYSAFFAANTIIRILGVSCTHFEWEQLQRVHERVDAIGQQNPVPVIQSGSYRCEFNQATKLLTCNKIQSSGGAHEALWSLFSDEMKGLGEKILRNKPNDIELQYFVGKLHDLDQNLSFENRANGNWLSYFRNQVNYKQNFGVWFPYKDGPKKPDQLFKTIKTWTQNPLKINLDSYSSAQKVERFLSSCMFIIGFCNHLILDVALVCDSKHHFSKFGPIAFLNLKKEKIY